MFRLQNVHVHVPIRIYISKKHVEMIVMARGQYMEMVVKYKRGIALVQCYPDTRHNKTKMLKLKNLNLNPLKRYPAL